MVKIYDFLYLSYIGYCKKYQLAIDTVTDFNQKVDEIQREAITILGNHYQQSEKVRSLVTPWVRRIYDTTDQNGQLLQPSRVGVEEETTEEFYRLIGMGVTDGNGGLLYNIDPIMENELMLTMRIPQRQPNLAKQRAYYLPYDDVIQLYPQQEIPYILFYLIYPTTAILAFTYQEVDGEYVQVYDPVNSVDLYWDKSASNLLLYMLLEKYGVSSRDDILNEFGKFGVQLSLEAQQQ